MVDLIIERTVSDGDHGLPGRWRPERDAVRLMQLISVESGLDSDLSFWLQCRLNHFIHYQVHGLDN